MADLFHTDMGDNLVAAAPDDIIQNNKVFQDYVEKVVGVAKYQNYFNAGILLMNLDALRKFDFQKKFLYLLETVKFSVAQDQDYLNRLCKGRVTLVDRQWDCMPLVNATTKREDIKLVHLILHVNHGILKMYYIVNIFGNMQKKQSILMK